MATTIEELQQDIARAVTGGFRNRLMDRGKARSMIWRDGQLPDGSPAFAQSLSYDLYSYSYALLGMGLRLRENGGNQDIARLAFENAAMALESILVKGSRADEARNFHYVIAAASYHLGRFSARAYSLLMHGLTGGDFSPAERCLIYLILRNLNALETEIINWRVNGSGTDENILDELESNWGVATDDGPLPETDGNSYVADALGSAIIDNFMAGMGLFLFALERGERQYVDQSIERLRSGLDVCSEVNLLPQWWMFRLAIHIVDDLWSSSFHARLPLLPNSPDDVRWGQLRRHFIALLFARNRAEIDLWPSQLDAVQKVVDENKDLVVSLPTSSGKTRGHLEK
jgi:hypothetical protein